MSVRNLRELLADREFSMKVIDDPTWVNKQFGGESQFKQPFDQYVEGIEKPSGFIWGEGIWGVDAVDAAASNEADKYGLS
jgi:hypothetical protein